MKKFSFSLEKVLNLREFDENHAKEELGRVIGIANNLNSELQQIAHDRVLSRKSSGNLFNANEFLAVENYVNRLDIRKEEILKELVEVELQIAEKRQLFTEAMQKRKVISKLKEKQLKDWKSDLLKEEESFVDDITNAKHFTKSQ